MRSRKNTGNASGRTPWAAKIVALRQSLRDDQKAFAERIGVAQPTVSLWETGRMRPSAETFIKLGNLAPLQSDSLWFWKAAGVNERALSAVAASLARMSFSAPAPREGVRIPFVPDRESPAALVTDLETRMPFPALLVDKPGSTICMQVKNRMPLHPFGGDDFILVDLAARDCGQLWGKLVAAQFTGTGKNRAAGIYVGWLHPYSLRNRKVAVLMAINKPDELYALDQLVLRNDVELEGRSVDLEVSLMVLALEGGMAVPIGISPPRSTSVKVMPGWRILGRVKTWIARESENERPKKGSKK